MRVSVKSCIGDHDGFVALVPERGVITEPDVGNQIAVTGNIQFLDRQIIVMLERVKNSLGEIS